MADRNPGFEVVVDNDAPRQPAQPDPNAVAIKLIQIGITTLSQRALVALMDCFTLITVASAFWLWSSIPQPNDRQIIALSIYAVFVLAANWIVRTKK